MNLLDYMSEQKKETESPLASRLRPTTLDEVVGQKHIIGKDKLLYRAIQADKLSSLIFYGPPGTGKTTLAKVIANTTSAAFLQINATSAGKKDMEEVVEKAKEYGIPIRVGVNSGSLEKNLLEKYGGVTAEGIVESALDKVQMIENMGYDNLVVSIKSSDVMMCVKAHELIAKECPYPLHVGITESGTLLSGNIKSSVGLGIILYQGIGDTIRVSLTGDPLEEIKSAKLILKALGLRKGGIEVVSCPTCGRTKIDLIGLANQVEMMVAEFPLDIKVAVMGCVVNGPGEAREADLGIAGGIGEGLLIKKGEIIRKVKEDELLDALRNELEHWGE